MKASKYIVNALLRTTFSKVLSGSILANVDCIIVDNSRVASTMEDNKPKTLASKYVTLNCNYYCISTCYFRK